MADRLQYALLGALELVDESDVLPVQGTQQRALLATLLAHRGVPVSDDALVEALWPDTPPPSAVHTLRTHVSRLRRLVGDDVRTVDGGYVLDVPADATDAGMFESVIRSARAEEAPDAVLPLTTALGLWRGPAFGRSADLPAVAGEARRLDTLRLDAMQDLAAALLVVGRADEAGALADQVTGLDPFRELAWALAVRARSRTGRAAEALEVFGRAAATLDEIGLLPGAELRAAQAEALSAAPPPAGRATGSRVGRATPVPLTSYETREGEVDAVLALLGAGRLVTLVGPGGVGKTRLALEVARALPAARTRFVELGAVRDATDVGAAVVSAAGMTSAAGPPAQALARLGDQDLVVVLDNCEHVVDAAAEVVDQLLGTAGPLRVLATSREPLRSPAEHVHVVEPLDDASARRLFLARARAAGARVTAESDEDAVARVVGLLDGLPLALEMAGSRAAAVSVPDLAEELEARLGALAHDGRSVVDRHRSLGALVGWSAERLDDEARRALTGWPVFAGAVTPGDAARALGVDRSAVETLAARSLLVRDDAHGRTRLRMLRTVRAAVGEPAEDAPVRARHAGVVGGLLYLAAARLRGPAEAVSRTRIDDLLPEARAAVAWAGRHDRDLAVRITRALHDYAVDGLADEVLAWSAALVTGDEVLPVAETSLAARLVLAGRHAEGAVHARRALDAEPDVHVRLRAMEVLGDVALFQGDLAGAAALGDRLTVLAYESVDAHYVVIGHTYRALSYAYTGRVEEARAVVETCRRRVAELVPETCPTTESWLLFTVGEIEADADPVVALSALRDARDLADSTGNRYVGGVARAAATTVSARHGDPATARAEFAEVLRWWLDSGDRTHLVTTLRNLVVLLARSGDDERAARLWGTAVQGDGMPTAYGTERDRLDETRAGIEARLGAERLATLVASGRTRSPEAAARELAEHLAAGQSSSR